MTVQPNARNWPARLFAALPDAVLAGSFLVIWIAPFTFGPHGVRNALLTMLVEFVVVHASGFLGAVALNEELSRGKRVGSLLGFAAFYALFIGAFVLIFDETWPILVFFWLLFGKFSGALSRRRLDEKERERQGHSWALSVALYVGGVFLTLMLPLPRLGMSTAVQPQFGLDGGGVWVDEPHRVVVFGLLYFGALAWFKWRQRD